ncbi:Uncharacterised protein [Bartonella grahamii]|uniref:Uncharacterized protein n=1 Tax=Bartonella grahamii TaxID=33045 RepID=A0A336N9X3_BARGR|nr:Uncharacterised protein [Bartonella grahamii]
MFRINLDENSITRLNDFQTIVLNDSAIFLIDSVFYRIRKLKLLRQSLM